MKGRDQDRRRIPTPNTKIIHLATLTDCDFCKSEDKVSVITRTLTNSVTADTLSGSGRTPFR